MKICPQWVLCCPLVLTIFVWGLDLILCTPLYPSLSDPKVISHHFCWCRLRNNQIIFFGHHGFWRVQMLDLNALGFFVQLIESLNNHLKKKWFYVRFELKILLEFCIYGIDLIPEMIQEMNKWVQLRMEYVSECEELLTLEGSCPI